MVHPGQGMQQPADETATHTHLLVRERGLRQHERCHRNQER